METPSPQQVRRTLSSRVIKWLFSIYFLVALTLTAIQLYVELHYEKKQVDAEIEHLFQNFEDVLSAAVWTLDEAYIATTVDGMLKNEIIQQVIVMDVNGEPIIIREASEGARVLFAAISKYQFELSYREEGIQQHLGQVQLYSSESVVIDRAKHTIYSIVINAAIKTLCLWLLLMWVFKRLVARPLMQLTQFVDCYARDGQSLSEPMILPASSLRYRRDELGLLTNSFLELQQRLDEQQRALMTHQTHLQQLVGKQTQQLQEAVRQLNTDTQLQHEFLSNVTHEIRTPMNAISIAAQLLSNSQLSDEQLETTSMINKSCQHLLSVVNDILDFVRMESDKFAFEAHSFDLASMVIELQNTFMPLVCEKSLYFNIDYANNCPYQFIGDKKRIYQILSNLLRSAIQYTDDGGVTLILGHRYIDDVFHLVVEVQDTGKGLQGDSGQLVFNASTLSDKSLQRNYSSCHLGLVISKRLIGLMHGKLEVVENEVKGSTYRLTLPLQPISMPVLDEEIEQRNGNQSALGMVPFQHLKVLYAEDNHINQVLGEQLLRSLGIQVVLASDGEQALALLKTQSFDLVLMDIQMPKLDGLTATQRLRASDFAMKDIPVIALTANEYEHSFQECEQAGMNGYIEKPFEVATLVAEIRRCLHNNDMIESS